LGSQAVRSETATHPSILLTEIAIATPPEIAEAWSFLDLLPRKVIPELHAIRIMLREIVRTIESAPSGTRLKTNTYGNPYLKTYFETLDVLEGACKRSMEDLNAAIDRVQADE
jgi:hypothetical protein